MNRDKILQALDKMSEGIRDIKNEIIGTTPLADNVASVYKSDGNNNSEISKDILAKKLAYAYSTMHPEYKIHNQYLNLREMIEGNKISYVLSWLRKGDIRGIESLFNLDVDTKRSIMLEAVMTHEVAIESIFKQRFGHDN